MSNTIKKHWLTVIMHVSAWLILIVLPQIIISRTYGNGFINIRFITNAGIYGCIFYICYLWTIPKFFFEKNKLPFVTITVAAVAFLFFISYYLNDMFRNPEMEKAISETIAKVSHKETMLRPPGKIFHFYEYILFSVVAIGFAIGLCFIEKHSESEKRQKELEKEKLNSELVFLKNQMSPHFFFNTLNNIYSLVEINKEDAQESILKLSKLMRYLLYETESGMVKLCQEIDFMQHYIDLMKLRLSDKVEVSASFPDGNINQQVPPLLFISFIENAFKHGISYRNKSFIRISMKTEQNKISFICENSIGNTSENLNKNHSGIGLQNVQKRLDLLFPEKHYLTIKNNEEKYFVSLTILLPDDSENTSFQIYK